MISIFDYGAGNLRSVQNTLGAIGAEYELVRTPEALRRATKIILPGVGHFGQMMRAVDALDVREPLKDAIRAGVPFLGICLGLQALFESSEEAPEVPGLGIWRGECVRFPAEVKSPHVGWNQLEFREKPSRLLHGIPSGSYVYFTHSYRVPLLTHTVAECEYGGRFSAIVEKDHLFGVQFHPEKSGAIGLKLLNNFCSLSISGDCDPVVLTEQNAD